MGAVCRQLHVAFPGAREENKERGRMQGRRRRQDRAQAV